MREGDFAPDFSLPDQEGKIHKLSDYKGKWVLLYFYPKDNTPGCTTEACNFRDTYKEIEKLNVVILGVSADSVESHKKFAQKYSLNFPLLADTKKEVIKMYGADGFLFPKRISFLISPEGKIVKFYKKVNPRNHAREVLEDIKKLIDKSF